MFSFPLTRINIKDHRVITVMPLTVFMIRARGPNKKAIQDGRVAVVTDSMPRCDFRHSISTDSRAEYLQRPGDLTAFISASFEMSGLMATHSTLMVTSRKRLLDCVSEIPINARWCGYADPKGRLV